MNRLRSIKGGGLGAVLISLAIMLITALIFINVADYSLFSYKTKIISNAIDNAVCAAVQEIDTTASKDGLSTGFDELTGKRSINNIVLNKDAAVNAFYSTLKSDTGIDRTKIQARTLFCIVEPTDTTINYTIIKESTRINGTISNPNELQSLINNNITTLYGGGIGSDTHVIRVNGNIYTNEFKKVPYFMAFIRDYQINGVKKERTATFVGFKSAKMERKK